MENHYKLKSLLNHNDTLDTNFSENQSLNSSFISVDNINNKKKVTFNEKISIILVDSYKKENKKNSISYDLIRENIKKVQNSNMLYQPKSQNCFVCNIF